MAGVLGTAAGNDQLRRLATAREQKNREAPDAHLEGLEDELARSEGKEDTVAVVGEERPRGGAPRCTARFAIPVAKPCKEETQEGLEVMLADAGSESKKDGGEFARIIRRPWRNRGG